MNDWKDYKLGDLYDVSSGLSKSADQFGSGFVFISFKDVFNNYFIPEFPDGLVNSNEKDRKTCSVQKGDILITRTSEVIEEVGMSSVALKDYENSTFNGFCKRLRPKKESPIKISPLFVGYLLRTRFFRKTVANYATMTTRASLNGESIKSIPLKFPPFNLQNEIGKTLYSLDQKITVLREQNQTLEELAQTLFKQWFVDFEFPDENGKPYKSSGGKMVESEMGEIPEGWRLGKLGKIATLKSGYAFKSEDFVGSSEVKALKIKDLKGKGIVDISDASSINKETSKIDRVKYFQLQEGDITVAMSGNTTGKIGVIPPHENELYLNQRVGKFFIKQSEYKSFLYNFFMSGNYEEKILSMGYGSAQPNINPNQIEEIDMLLPNEELLLMYFRISEPIYSKTLINNAEIQSLIRLRETLLPKLMSGELRVKSKL